MIYGEVFYAEETTFDVRDYRSVWLFGNVNNKNNKNKLNTISNKKPK